MDEVEQLKIAAKEAILELSEILDTHVEEVWKTLANELWEEEEENPATAKRAVQYW